MPDSRPAAISVSSIKFVLTRVTGLCHISQGEKRVLFDAVKDGQNIAPKWVAPEDEQEPNESRRYATPRSSCFLCCARSSPSSVLLVGGGRLWTRLTRAIVAKDMDAATRTCRQMLAAGLQPTLHHYGALMEGYAAVGDMDAAADVMRSATGAGVAPFQDGRRPLRTSA